MALFGLVSTDNKDLAARDAGKRGWEKLRLLGVVGRLLGVMGRLLVVVVASLGGLVVVSHGRVVLVMPVMPVMLVMPARLGVVGGLRRRSPMLGNFGAVRGRCGGRGERRGGRKHEGELHGQARHDRTASEMARERARRRASESEKSRRGD